ncbi:MAG: phosphatidylserine decarboxylase family protein [Candidatus Sumerlaeaceae bacterium]
MNYRPTNSPVASEAFPFAMPMLVITFVAFALGWKIVGVFAFFLFVYVLAFFRNPERYGTRNPNEVISGADGKIVAAGIIPHPDFPDGQCLRIAVFMSVFDVHVNWAPCAGEVTAATHHQGKFLNAMEDKCGEENERKVIVMRTPAGLPVVVKLVAGLVARRIVCPLERGDVLQKGDKIGLIRFGSRVEMLLPAACQLHVHAGQRVRGGESVVATLPPGLPTGFSELSRSDEQTARDVIEQP